MSEHVTHGHEQHKSHETHHDHHEAARHHEAAKAAERAAEAHRELKEQAERLSHHAKHEAASKDQYNHLQADQEQAQTGPMLVNAELKSMALKRTLTRVRKDLSVPDRMLSKVVHQPVVNALSEVGEKTVARPSGILSGGIIAFFGTGLVLYICKHYGYEYNFLLFALLFVGGFMLGLLLELVFFSLRRRHRA